MDERRERERELAWCFRRADRAVKKRMDERVRDTGVFSSQHRILMELNRNPDSSQAELAEKMEISPAAVAVSLKKLEKGGYISRMADERDCRVNQILITQKGRQVIEKSFTIFQTTDQEMFEGFTDEQMGQLKEYLEQICRNMGGERGHR